MLRCHILTILTILTKMSGNVRQATQRQAAGTLSGRRHEPEHVT
jgi:hypothetical protein